jgi:hypothetical protein
LNTVCMLTESLPQAWLDVYVAPYSKTETDLARF